MKSRMLLSAYAVLGFANVMAQAAGASDLAFVTKIVLMPLLAAWVLAAAGGWTRSSRPTRWLLIGLAFAWLGDVLLLGSGDGSFMGGLAAFLAMQVCFILAFTRVPGPGLVRAWKIAVVPYLLIWVGVNALVSAGVGAHRVPVLVYSAVLVLMALAALDLVIRVPSALGWRIAFGALLFVLSDTLIAMTAFGTLSGSAILSAVVMATYLAAQGMIATGLVGSEVARR